MNVTTNESILFQVAFKEACVDSRKGLLDDSDEDDPILGRTLYYYDDVLKKGLNILSERKNSSLAQFQDAVMKLKTVEQFKEFQNENVLALKNLSKEDSAKLKEICSKHFNINKGK